ncbi:MAG TPA: GatB/YqeY domain-containing protein [Thermomicrobiaceae bacterium]|nr:GatB/YqeY domain-containing protein [Thermomicrobiaceae bacterium]
MSELADRLLDDLKDAMRSGDVTRRETLRFLRAEIHNQEIEHGRPLTDAEIIEVVQRQIKQRRDSIEQFGRGGRPDLVAVEEAQIAVLEHYLPPQLSYDEVLDVARIVVQEIGASGARDMGRVMPLLRQRIGATAEGSTIAAAARAALAAAGA